MMPTSPRSLPDLRRDERNQHLPEHHTRNFDWTPPTSASDSLSSSESHHTQQSEHLPPQEISQSIADRSNERSRYHQRDQSHSESQSYREANHNQANFKSHGAPFSSMPPPPHPIIERLSDERNNTATVSPVRASRRIRLPNRYQRGRRSRSFAHSRQHPYMPQPHQNQQQLPLHQQPQQLSSSNRNNKIYLRIKRVVTGRAAARSTDVSISVPVGNVQTMHHHHHHHPAPVLNNNTHHHNRTAMLQAPRVEPEAETRFDGTNFSRFPSFPPDHYHHQNFHDHHHRIHPLPQDQFPLEQRNYPVQQRQQYNSNSDRFSMMQRLLAIETGPISWVSTGQATRPPDTLVGYLSRVVSEAVQIHLRDTTGKEYWIKHVRFWSDFLHPENRCWNTAQGLCFRGMAQHWYRHLHQRWRVGETIEYTNVRDKADSLRACILFARKHTVNIIDNEDINDDQYSQNSFEW